MQITDDMLFSKALRERLDMECALTTDFVAPQRWYAVKVLRDGKVVIERNYDPAIKVASLVTPDPAPTQMIWAEEAARILNKEIAHNGAWLVGFTHPPGMGDLLRIDPRFDWRRIIKLWIDETGDVAFTADIIDPFWMVMQRPVTHFIEQSEQCWQKWHLLMKQAIDPTPEQLIHTAHLKERGLA